MTNSIVYILLKTMNSKKYIVGKCICWEIEKIDKVFHFCLEFLKMDKLYKNSSVLYGFYSTIKVFIYY